MRSRHMPVLLLLALTLACRPPAPAGTAQADSSAIRRDIATLAADSLGGRFTGSPGADLAARFLARRLESLGLEPFACAAGAANGTACVPGFVQRFRSGSVAAAHAGITGELTVDNVAGLIPGSDPALRDEFIVIGAHYDHLGTSGFGVMDPDSARAIHNGADDNASGTAAVLELARLLDRRPLRRSVVIVLFGGEELGLLGSNHFVNSGLVPLDRVTAMLNFDMVGRLRSDRLIVYGTATADELPAIVDSANAEARFTLLATGDGFGSSDHAAFYAKGIPSLHFFTDLHGDYHRATDDADRISASGVARVVAFAERVARGIDARDALLTRRPPPPRMAGPGSSSRLGDVFQGSIPDMGATTVAGVRLSGIVPGSPAEQAGLREGDVIVEFAGAPIKDLYAYTDALYAKKPGDVVTVMIERDGTRIPVEVTLGKRGGSR